MSATKKKAKGESGETVTMTKHQFEVIERHVYALISVGKMIEVNSEEEPGPGTTIDILANGIADILEDVNEGRLDHGKMVRPVPPEPKGGAA